jgi:hypothetical protein
MDANNMSAVDLALATDDDVERPAHYRQGGVECIDAIRAVFRVIGRARKVVQLDLFGEAA